MKLLITGGAGFIGSAVTAVLAKKNHEVMVYDIDCENSRLNNIEYIKGHMFDIDYLNSVLKKCDGVVHMVGLPDVRMAQEYPQMSFDLNVRSWQILLEAARNKGVMKIVLPSSAAIYGAVEQSPITEETTPNPTSIYGYHKYVAEELAKAYSVNYGAHIIILRLFNVYGIRGAGILNILIEKASKGETVKLYGEKQKRDFIHVSEVADAFIRVLKHDYRFEIYNVGTGVGRSVEDIVNLVKEYFPALLVERGGYEGVFYDSVADITKLKNDTGFNPDRSDSDLRKVIEKEMSK